MTDSRDCKTGFLRMILKHCFSDYNTRSVDVLQDLRWHTLQQICSKQLTISIFKPLNKLYPEGLKNVFKPTSRVHSYNIKGISNNIFVVTACTGRPSTKAAKWAFSYRGEVMWNGLMFPLLMFVLLCSLTKKKTGTFPTFCHATLFHHALIACCNVARAGSIT